MSNNSLNTNKASSTSVELGGVIAYSKENKNMKINKENLIERINLLEDGNLVEETFNSIELAILLDTSFEELLEVIGRDSKKELDNTQYTKDIATAQYLFNLLVQYAVYAETEEYPDLYKIKEFGYNSEYLTPSVAATEFLQAETAKANRKEAV